MGNRTNSVHTEKVVGRVLRLHRTEMDARAIAVESGQPLCAVRLILRRMILEGKADAREDSGIVLYSSTAPPVGSVECVADALRTSSKTVAELAEATGYTRDGCREAALILARKGFVTIDPSGPAHVYSWGRP